MKKSKHISAALCMLLIVGGIFFFGYMLHISGRAETAVDIWLYGALALAPIFIGGAWFGALYRRMVGGWWHRGDWFGAVKGTSVNKEKRELTSDDIASRKAMRQAANRWTLIILGAFLVSLGIMVVLYNNGYIAEGWRRVFWSWQMILLAIGIGQLCEGKGINASIFLLVGGYFIAPRVAAMFPAIYEPARSVGFLPVLFIGLGVIVIIAAVTHSCRHKRGNCSWNNGEKFDVVREEVVTGDGRISENLRFSGMDKVILDPFFNGGNIDVRFAGAVLDLRHTALPEGVTTLYLNGSFGGINIIAPSDWRIEIQNDNSFGGFVDKRKDVVYDPNADRKLVIISSFRFGGGDITSYRK